MTGTVATATGDAIKDAIPPPPPAFNYNNGGPGPQNPAIPYGNGMVLVPEDECYCSGWYDLKGSDSEWTFNQVMAWVCFISCLCVLVTNLFLLFKLGRRYVAWEVIYVMCIVFTFYGFVIWLPWESPVMLWLNTGNFPTMLRYGQWLFATPVLLVNVSDMLGIHPNYSINNMLMVIADIFAVTIFVFCVLSTYFWVKAVGFGLSFVAFVYLFFLAFKCFKQLLKECPNDSMKFTVKIISIVFFLGWNMHTVFATIGPDVTNWLMNVPTEIGSRFSDMVAKVTYCVLATYLRFQYYQHCKKHGDPRDADKPEEEAKAATAVAASEHGNDAPAEKAAPPAKALQEGRVILAVPDGSMVDYFTKQFAQLPAPVELVPAVGPQNALMLLELAVQQGGLDCVLMHPQFLRDTSPNNLALRCKKLGQRVVVFGFDEDVDGPVLGWMLDGWLHGGVVDLKELNEVLTHMQALQKFRTLPPGGAAGTANGMGGASMMGGGMMNGGGMGGGMMGGGMGASMGGGMMGGGMGGSMVGGGMPTPQYNPMGSMGGGGLMNNPMYNAPVPAPMPQPQRSMQAAPANLGGDPSEAEVMQLMNEINRLKGELGER